MEDQVITSTTEPTIVESANTSAENTAGLSQVIDQATPMDSNVTYNSLPKESYSPIQNIINEAITKESNANANANAGKAMNSFLTQDYDYDKNEAGSYWVAGAINDNNTQMSFLQTLINEEMYDDMDLQKYYYDTNMATARAYAAQKNKEVAYGFYRAAQERAFAEGELTGWYMPAEGRYMLGQYTVAQNVLENPDSTVEEINKANHVITTTEEWFKANQITSRGIKCLAMMNYEESVRHNTIMGELSKQANDIAKKSVNASAGESDIALKLRIFQLEEEELQTGHNYTYALGLDNDPNFIGHKQGDYPNHQSLKGYKDVKEMLMTDSGAFNDVLMARNSKWLKDVLGDDYYKASLNYQNDQNIATFKAEIESNGGITENSFTKTGKKTTDGNEIVYTVINGKVVAGYFKDGVWTSITDSKKNFSDGTNIKTYFENMFGEGTFNTTSINGVEIDGEKHYFGRGSTSKENTSWTNLYDSGLIKFFNDNYNGSTGAVDWDKVNLKAKQSQTSEGTKDKDGDVVKNLQYMPRHVDAKGFNDYSIFKGEVNGKTQYYYMDGKGNLIKTNKVESIPSAKDTLKVGSSISMGNDFNGDSNTERIGKASWVSGYDPKNNITYMFYPDSDGSGEYYAVEGRVDPLNPKQRTFKVVKVNVSEDEVKNNGGNIPKENESTKAGNFMKVEYGNINVEQPEIDSKVYKAVNTSSPVPPKNSAIEYEPEYNKATYDKVLTKDTPKDPGVLTYDKNKKQKSILNNDINKVETED